MLSRSARWFRDTFCAGAGWLAAAACAALVANASPATGAPHVFRNGQLTIELFDLGPLLVPPSAPLASGVLDATRTETSITSIGLPARVFETTGFSIPITDPAADPLDGLAITAFNPAGTFTAAGGGAGGFGGKLPLDGVAKVCLIGGDTGCASAAVTLELPLSVVGQTKTVVLDIESGSPISITVQGAPWTTGAIQIHDNDGGVTTLSGGIEDVGEGYLGVELVTPLYISTAFPGSAVVPAWGVMRFEVPEPDVLVLGFGGVGALVLLGLQRRRRA